MEATKKQIMDFIIGIYNVSKWPYVALPAITNEIGYYPKNELNELYKEGKIKICDGIKGKLIELITTK